MEVRDLKARKVSESLFEALGPGAYELHVLPSLPLSNFLIDGGLSATVGSAMCFFGKIPAIPVLYYYRAESW